MIKSFRGLVAHGGTEHIRLSTNDGLTGYEIKKLEIITKEPAVVKTESIVKIFSVEPSASNGVLNFNDPTLLGMAYVAMADDGYNSSPLITIFDHVKVNQDIYITAVDIKNSTDTNYYLELEQIKLDLNEATVATLKDMRGRE